MNERIKELALDSGAVVTGIVATNYGKDIKPICEIDIEKFAHLIIRECAEFARQHNLERAKRSHLIHKAIKEHFGVTE